MKPLKTVLYYHPLFLRHRTGHHPEQPARLQWVLGYIHQSALARDPNFGILEPQTVELEQILRVHTSAHVNFIKGLAIQGGGRIDSDTIVSKESFSAALLAAGTGITAAKAIQRGIIENAFGLIRPPGHHATASQAMGFCLFNNIAILAQYLLDMEHAKRILIFDFDAHHGNGTQELFYRSPRVLYFGLHQDGATLWPMSGFPDEVGDGDGKGFTVNLSLPPFTDSVGYLNAIDQVGTPIFEQYQPDYILFSAGYDTYYKDPLTDMRLTSRTYYKITQQLRVLAKRFAHSRLVGLLEGGYDQQGLTYGVYNTLLGMLGSKASPAHEQNDVKQRTPKTQELVEKAIAETQASLSPYWSFH